MLPRRFVYRVVCGIFSIVLALAEGPVRPACNADMLSKMWPLAANGNKQLTNRLFNCGELQVCTRGKWRYRWVSLSVRLDQLNKTGQAPKACTALMNEVSKAEADGRVIPQTSSLEAAARD